VPHVAVPVHGRARSRATGGCLKPLQHVAAAFSSRSGSCSWCWMWLVLRMLEASAAVSSSVHMLLVRTTVKWACV
jgi:hypothetical protein